MKLTVTKMISSIFIIAASLLLWGCSSSHEPEKPAALVKIQPQVNIEEVWSHHTRAGRADRKYLLLQIGTDENNVYIVGPYGKVIAFNGKTGKKVWAHNLDTDITMGISVGEGLALVGDEHGEIYALNTANGKIRWQQNVGQQVLALPTISNSITIVKTISDTVIALSTKTGQILWNYNVGAPTMILRGGSKPSIAGDSVITGFANGKMASLSLNQGNLNWMQTIATPQGVFEVQRMVDIDVAPIVKDMVIYDATYQGNLAAIELGSGQMIWNHKMSAYTGIALSNIGLYVTDANSEVWSFQADNGGVNWHQVALKGRQITAPALVSSYFDDYLIVGDDNGYLHWLSQRSGEFVARERLSWEPIRAVPVVKNGLIYVLDARGYIAAYKIISKRAH